VTDFKEPRTEIEWSRRAIINVVDVLAVHAESRTLVGAHGCFAANDGPRRAPNADRRWRPSRDARIGRRAVAAS
jgi:hypothetical protein